MAGRVLELGSTPRYPVFKFNMPNVNPRQLLAVIGFACLLLVPSFDMPLKYLGLPGLIGYFVVGLVGILVCYYFIVPKLSPIVTERVAVVLLLLTFIALIGIVAVIYPLANAGRFGGGSDMDDALIIGVTEILNGRYPYYQRTYLTTTLSPMPGAFILAIPFVVTGLVAFQNIVWLGAWVLTIKKFLGRYSYALLALWTVLAISPSAYQVLVTGSDHISNTLYVLIPMWLIIGALTASTVRPSVALISAILLGVGLSSRSNFMLVTPLFFSVLVQTAGWKPAIKYCAVVAVTFVAVTLPFYLYDPAGFAPLDHSVGRLQPFNQVLPGATVIVPLSTALLTGFLAFTRMGADCVAFFRNAAIVQIFALYFPSILYAIWKDELSLYMGAAGYGMFTLMFAATSVWIYLTKRANTPDEPSPA
jgi:hypothetical protein